MATIRALMTVLNKLGVDDDQRKDLIADYTNGRTSSARGLYGRELTELVTRLNGMLPETQGNAQRELLMKKKRSAVLSIATRVGIHNTADWKKFNNWMLQRSILKKPLHLYDIKELDDLLKQMYALQGNYERSANKPLTRAWWHKNKDVVGLN